jgi:hypothetical protein
MRKSIAVTLSLALFSCVTTTRITGSWANPKRATPAYSSIFVVAFTKNALAKSTVESDMATNLNHYGVATMKSIEEFPLRLNDSIDTKALMTKVKEKQAEGILTISLIKKETDSRYLPGTCVYRPVYYYYGRLWDYYSYWYPCVYSPGYYINNEIYFIEVNLYDAKSEELVWSAQSEIYNPIGLTSFSRDFSYKIVKQLRRDGLLKPASIVHK